MALGDKGANYNTYLSIFGGSIVQEWRKEPAADKIPDGKDLQERENKNGKKVYYVEYDYVAGLIKDVELDTTGDFGSRVIITLQDVDDNYKITLPLNSAYCQNLLYRLRNIDLTKEISLEPWSMNSEEWFKLTRKKTANGKNGLVIKQDDEKVEPAFTRDSPNGLPELEVKETRQGTKYYSDDRDDFLLEELEAFIKKVKGESDEPKKAAPAKSKPTGKGKKATKAPEPDEVGDDEEEVSDLPW